MPNEAISNVDTTAEMWKEVNAMKQNGLVVLVEYVL